MSLCGNCPVLFEDTRQGIPEEDFHCHDECTYQDAVYKIQNAYWSLYEDYETLLEKIKND